jgi:hypothetical protein
LPDRSKEKICVPFPYTNTTPASKKKTAAAKPAFAEHHHSFNIDTIMSSQTPYYTQALKPK